MKRLSAGLLAALLAGVALAPYAAPLVGSTDIQSPLPSDDDKDKEKDKKDG